ncbi:carboxylesterase family protein [Sphingobacterium paludis]|uniref:Putative esterase n=1 Tax=Sphingobacterium paludis TaxID=1476465 RepID=A0A4R7CUQ2_9SPHI|nr:PHB depolymerase family esterase [Sphingobacterium paludis]TDS07559.1 putative esterase [Sphingobacterium paludis]
MNLKTLLFLCFFIPFAKLLAQEKTKAKYNYLLYLPKDYAKTSKRYPVVVYLHGGSHKGQDLNKLKGYGLPYLIDKGEDFEFIIASPQCPDNKYWSNENWFDSLYLDLSEKYRIDSKRMYVTGISMGGYGAYTVAMDFPEIFAAIVPLCGGINDSDTSRICNLRDIPIWTFHGTADDKIPIKETERIAAQLRFCKGNMKFTRLENAGHGIEYLYEKNREIYTWMLKQRR